MYITVNTKKYEGKEVYIVSFQNQVQTCIHICC